MADLATQVLGTSGAAPSTVAASASDTAEVGSGGNTVAVYKNSTGSPVDVTVITPATLGSGDPYPDKVVTVPANGEAWILLVKDYLDPDIPGRCTITGATGLNVSVVRVI